jgi:hypothetical protein
MIKRLIFVAILGASAISLSACEYVGGSHSGGNGAGSNMSSGNGFGNGTG